MRRTRTTRVGAVVRTTDGTEFAGVNVENAAYPLDAVRGEDGDRRRCRRRATARATSPRSASTRRRAAAAASGSTSGGSPRSRSGAPTARSRRTTRRNCCRTRGTSPNEVGFRRRRRAAERRQVDARQRAHRREGRDRLRQAAHDAPPRSAACYTDDDAQLVLVDLPGWQKPIDTLTERMQDRVDDAMSRATSTRCCSSSTRASGSARATATSRAGCSGSASRS